MAEESGDRSQDATPHRRQQAREEGHVAKSQDLGSALLLLLAAVALLTLHAPLTDFIGQYTRQQLGEAPLFLDVPTFVAQSYGAVWGLAKGMLPILGLLFVGGVAVDLAQVGLLFLPEKVMPDLSRLDPLQGLQRLFSVAGAARLGFGLFKILIIAVVAAIVLYGQRTTILRLTELSVAEIAAYLLETLLWTCLKIAVVLVILALLDFGFQRWKYSRDLRMTPQEVREEMKNLEGNPQVAARRRVVARQLMLNRLSKAVPKADVVVTNPTELAVALQYDPEQMAAPVVVAKGAGLIAQRIRRLALENNIPILERKPLAQALYRDVDLNHPVPADKFAAVAEVLAYVYQLKGKKIPTPKRA
jgi:flagellar biosynthetic protein FlhB